MSFKMENCSKYLPLQIIHHHFPRTKDEFVKLTVACGCGGFVINAAAPWNTDDTNLHKRYLTGQEDFKELESFILWCKEYSLRVWIYDEPGFPSGAAGRRVIAENPHLRVKGMCRHSVPLNSSAGEIKFDKGTILSAVAVNPLTESHIPVNADGVNVGWDLPDSSYTLLITEYHELDWITGSGVPYVDLLNPETTGAFIKSTYEAYKTNLSEEAFRYIEAYFTDEPGLPVHGCSMIFDEPIAVLPWTDDLPSEFHKKYGYDLIPKLHVLFGDEGERVKRDYWQWVSERFAESFFGKITDWCKNQNQFFTGHLYGEETLAMQTGLNGTLFDLECNMSIPGVDRLFCTNPKMVLPEKTASSAAKLIGRKAIMSESSSHFEQAVYKCDYDINDAVHSLTFQYVLGVNTIASYFHPNEFGEGDLKKAYEYIAKVGYATEGRHRAQFLFLLPTEDAWSMYSPTNHKYWSVDPSPISNGQPNELIQLDITLNQAMKSILDGGFDFDLIDLKHLFSHTKIESGRIIAPQESYEAFIFIETSHTDAAIYSYISTLAKNNISVIIIAAEVSEKTTASELAAKYPEKVFYVKADSLSEILYKTAAPYLKVMDSNRVWLRTTESENDLTTLLYCHSEVETKVMLGGFISDIITVLSPLENTIIQKNICGEICEITFPKKAGIIIKQKLCDTNLK